TLPTELIAYIISFLDISAAKTTYKDACDLMFFVYDNIEAIKAMVGTPGCVSVMQKKEDGANTFTLFKTADNLSLLYHAKHAKDGAKSFAKDEIKDKYAASYFVQQARLLKEQSAKLAFSERLENTRLYSDLKRPN